MAGPACPNRSADLTPNIAFTLSHFVGVIANSCVLSFAPQFSRRMLGRTQTQVNVGEPAGNSMQMAAKPYASTTLIMGSCPMPSLGAGWRQFRNPNHVVTFTLSVG